MADGSQPIYGLQIGGISRSRARVTLSSTFTDENGAALMPRGTNQGNWGQNYQIDAAAIAGLGANCVRILIRVLRAADGNDSYSASSLGHLTQSMYEHFMDELDWLEAQGIYIIVALDTDYGAGGRGLGTTDWNFFDTLDTAGQIRYTAEFTAMWEYIVRNNMRRKRILAWELLPEPLPSGSTSAHNAGLKAFYLNLMNRIRAIDPSTPFLIGGRASYGINNIDTVLFTERNDVIYTADFLTNKVQDEDGIAASIELVKAFRDTYSKPVLIQQFGRNTSEDEGNGTTTDNLGLTALNGGLFMLRALGIPFTHWQYHQNSTAPGNYALWYKINANVDADDNWTPKTAEINSFAYHMGITHASLEAAAVAAATACGGELFYVKSDFSNVFQDSAGTTPVTAVGQPIGRINAVVGSRNFTQATSGFRPNLAAAANGYSVSFLNGSESWLGCDTAFFTTADVQQCAIVAARPPTSASNRNLLHGGTSGSVVRWPNILVAATDECQASWRGDDNVLKSAQTTTLCDNRALVATAVATKTTNNLDTQKVLLQGVQEGSTGVTAPGTIASITRLRWGASSTGSNGLGGPSPLLFVCRNAVTDTQMRAIARFGAWLVGCPFRAVIN